MKTKRLTRKPFILRMIGICAFFGLPAFLARGQAVYVSNLKATYRHGQVFLTWTCPAGTGYKYKIYRSTSPLDKKSKINSSTYLGGYVLDSSSLNVRLTRKLGVKTFYTIEDGGQPLSANTGLYVVTCDAPGAYYYAVTVTRLSNGKEYSKMTVGSNTLATPVQEYVADPQPVLQGSFVTGSTGETCYRYVQFGDHRNLPHYPYMFNQGSYGFNFIMIYRGNYVGGPLYVFYEGIEGSAFIGSGLEQFSSFAINNCIMISMDDWIPLPNGYGSTAGSNTFWTGYHENFNPYILTNPIPTTGTIRMYHQHRYIHTIRWACKYLPIDSHQVNLVGKSAGGFGALVTAMIIPKKINTVYSIVAPIKIKSYNFDSDTSDEQLWGKSNSRLPCDILDQITGTALVAFDLMDIKTMMQKYTSLGLPVIYTIHGKNDATVGWSDKPDYLNQNEQYWHGGVHFWDQRKHDGSQANFFDSEITPPFSKFRANISYPAVSNCDINQNPGDGNPANGDPYGAFSAYVTFDSVTDNPCKWTCKFNLVNYTVGGVAQGNYTACYADITLRRTQHFKPTGGATIKWANYDKDNVKIQSGSFTYSAGANITIGGVKIKKSGNRLEVEIKNCLTREETDEALPQANPFHVTYTHDGWQLTFSTAEEGEAHLQLVDMLGRVLEERSIWIARGMLHHLPAPGRGTYILRIRLPQGDFEQTLVF
ncbi:MAG: hypothetical protein NZL95_04450 [Chitinophagales bacterium]|nr:hypothetical protein [Chitinophagales bacterium]MDW8427782.1 hypothetical protein [Chitinophagales bacterium]